MSFSKPKPKNPVTKWIEYKGKHGTFSYFDKSKGEKGENVEIPLSEIKFIVLDQLNAISGFNKPSKSRIYSNEVRNLKTEKLDIKSFSGSVHIIGLYSDVKDNAYAKGGKFTKSVYAGLIKGDDLELVNFSLSGSGFEGWVEFSFDEQTNYVSVSGFADKENGDTKYKMPLFQANPIPANLIQKAIELDRHLQEYLSTRDLKEVESKEVIPNSVDDIIDNPYEKMKQATSIEDVLAIWNDNISLRSDSVFVALKEEMKKKFLNPEPVQTPPEIIKMQNAKELTELDTIVNEIKNNGWRDYPQDYRELVEQTYKKRSDELLPF